MTSDRPVWKTKDRRRLLIAILTECTVNSRISFEGQLSKLPLLELEAISLDETTILKRGTTWPKQDFVVLPIDAFAPSAIIAALGGSIPSAVLHIQVEKDGKLVFGAFDNFQHLHLGDLLGEQFVDQLVSNGILQRVK
jgi:hypothetical protein